MSDLDFLLNFNVSIMDRFFKNREVVCGVVDKLPIIIRLDGVNFGKVLKDFEKPRDYRVHDALIEAGKELMRKFSSSYVLVISDEINVVLMNYLPYGGRVFKLITIASGLASSITSLKLKVNAYFDARVVKLEDFEEVIKYLMYRVRVGFNNYVLSVAFSKNIVSRKCIPKLKEVLKNLEGITIDWRSVGTLLIRERVVKEVFDKLRKVKTVTTRSVIRQEISIYFLRRLSQNFYSS